MPQLSPRLEPRMPFWGPPSSLGHNLRISRSTSTRFPKYKYKVPKVQVSWNTSFLRTSTYKNALQALEVLQPYFKASKGISCTSLRSGVLTRFGDFFSYDSLNSRKQRIHTDKLRTRATFHVSSTKNSFFWFTSSGVHKQPVSFDVWASAWLFLQGSHVRRQYWKRTTLCSKSSTINGLLYAPEPHNRKKGTLSDQPQLSCISSMALLCCWGRRRSKVWCPLWLTLRCMPYGRGTLRIPLRRIL